MVIQAGLDVPEGVAPWRFSVGWPSSAGGCPPPAGAAEVGAVGAAATSAGGGGVGAPSGVAAGLDFTPMSALAGCTFSSTHLRISTQRAAEPVALSLEVPGHALDVRRQLGPGRLEAAHLFAQLAATRLSCASCLGICMAPGRSSARAIRAAPPPPRSRAWSGRRTSGPAAVCAAASRRTPPGPPKPARARARPPVPAPVQGPHASHARAARCARWPGAAARSAGGGAPGGLRPPGPPCRGTRRPRRRCSPSARDGTPPCAGCRGSMQGAGGVHGLRV